MQKCNNCGADFEGNFCPKCGTPAGEATNTTGVNNVTAETTTAIKSNKTGNSLLNYIWIPIVILLLIWILPFGGNYKDPLKKLEKGLNKGDSEKIVASLFTDDMLKDAKDTIEDEYGDMDDFYDEIDDYYEWLEEELGDDLKFKIKIEDKEKVKSKKLEDYEKAYKQGYDIKAKVKKAYKLDCTIKIKGDKESKEIDDIELIVVKVKGEGWLILPESANNAWWNLYLELM